MKFGIDVSAYDYVDYSVVAPNVDLVVIKLDNRSIEHVNGFSKYGVPIAYYLWYDPTLPTNTQVVYCLDGIRKIGVTPLFLAIDLEQWWSDWRMFYKFLRGEVQGSSVPKVSPKKLADGFISLYDGIHKVVDFPVIVYTRTTFVRDYMTPYYNVLSNKKLWLALYVIPKVRWMLWEDARNYAQQLSLSALVPPPGCSIQDVIGWQFTDRAILPGNYNNKFKVINKMTDLNVFSDELKVTVTFENATKAKVNAKLGLNIREAPNLKARKIGLLRHGETVLIDAGSLTDGFVKLVGRDGWVYHKYLDLV